jgi:hypothetical protein
MHQVSKERPALPAPQLRSRRDRRAARAPVIVQDLMMPGVEVACAEARPRETVTAFLRRTGWATHDRTYGWQFHKGLPTILEINGECVGLSAPIAAGSANATQATANFPTTFNNAMLVSVSSMEVAWIGLLAAGGNGAMNTAVEISDRHEQRFTEQMLMPFARATFPTIEVQGANVAGAFTLRLVSLSDVASFGQGHCGQGVSTRSAIDVFGAACAPNSVLGIKPKCADFL